MKRIWYGAFSMLLIVLIGVASAFPPLQAQSTLPLTPEGLQLKQVGTRNVYFAYNKSPLLSFGGLSDFIFYAAPDAFDYKVWANWAATHGMNHIRAYPPFSWKYIEKFAEENGGSPENLLFPYEETSPGSRQFDLTQFNAAYWQRFREQCEYLHSKGIIIHLLMMNGWQLLPEPQNWGGHFFNPDNNINRFTDVLAKNRLGFYQSVSNRQQELIAAQQAWLWKIVEVTADLDNVYYDLVHEIAENYQDWGKAKAWIDKMAQTVREAFSELQPERSIILGMDTGGLERSQRNWIFGRPYFDVLIYGKSHQFDQAQSWRNRYKKPYIPQEAWDEDKTKYGYREPSFRAHLRKYLWKFMMAKCQQLDFYIKPRIDEQLPGFPHNYDPNGWNPFEKDAVILRETWERLTDYPNLLFSGSVQSGPGAHRYVLSSQREALVYLSSDTGEEDISYEPQEVQLNRLALQTGTYAAEIIKPDQGILSTLDVTVDHSRASLTLPAFVDDLALHLLQEGQPISQSPNNRNDTQTFNFLVVLLITVISALTLWVFFVSTGKRNA